MLNALPTPERVLVVFAHPDDAEFGCAGTVARWAREGAHIVYVLATSGDSGTSDRSLTPERLAAIREAEQIEAARMLGVREVVFLRYPDGGLEDTKEFRGKVVREIRRVKPDVVLTSEPFPRLRFSHRDHRIAGLVAMDACYPYCRDHLYYPEHLLEGLDTHKVGAVLFWGPDQPDVFSDITDTLETKLRALACHKSQFSDFNAVAERVKEWARLNGQRVEVPYAEAFRKIEFAR
ncbi:MAG: PIG-L family deacetylase [Dehalococcoidia bacterium]|nr:PIG-L family deacetylase [Dehalococcoidia bacterium]MDW8120147.1 PIG-L deacetylase family protein [Chloroflexota bacterium]